jgi:hypothetical protein
MIVGLTLELEHGVEGYIRFPSELAGGAALRCPRPPHCHHTFTQQQCEQLLERVGITYDGDPLSATRKVVNGNKAFGVFDAIHDVASEANGRLEFATAKELLELYQLGFGLQMLADHFGWTTRDVVRRLSALIFDDYPVMDHTTARHQQRWTDLELEILEFCLECGFRPTELDVLDRDSLGIAYKAFEVFRPAVPDRVVQKYSLHCS